MQGLFDLLGLVNQRSHSLKLSVFYVIHRYRVCILLEHLANSSESLIVIRSKEIQTVTVFANSCSPTATMDVNLSIEWALVMKNIAHIWNIETSCSDIGAHKNCSFLTMATFDVPHASFEPIQILQPLSLLHFGMKTAVFDFHEVEEACKSTGCCDGVAENDHRLALVLLHIIVHV